MACIVLPLLVLVRGLVVSGPQRLAIERRAQVFLAPSGAEPPFSSSTGPLHCVLDRTTEVVNRVDGFKLTRPGWTRGLGTFDGIVVSATRRGPTSIECDVPKVVRAKLESPIPHDTS